MLVVIFMIIEFDKIFSIFQLQRNTNSEFHFHEYYLLTIMKTFTKRDPESIVGFGEQLHLPKFK